MMNSPSPKTAHKRKKSKNFISALWNGLTYNWGWKLACLILAAFIWTGIVSQDTTLTREKVFSNVEVSFTGAASLQRNGYIVVGGLDESVFVQIKAQVPQRNYDSASASSYNVRVDLSAISQTGEVTVPVIATATTTYGSVVEISPAEVTLTVERYVTRNRIPVSVQTTGNAPAGLYTGGEIRSDPTYVTVAGPLSKVSQITVCEAVYDLSQITTEEGTHRAAVPFTLYNARQEEVDSSQITVYANDIEVDSITVEQNIYLMIAQNLSQIGIVQGEPAQGYEVKRISVSPDSVMIAVQNAGMLVSDLAYLEGAVDITGLHESLTSILPVSRPNNIIYMSSDVVYVTVEIGPVEEETP